MRKPGALLIGSLLYLSAIFGVMLWRGISIEPEWVVLALLVVAIALGRGLAFVADWGPFLLLFLAYEAMRGFAAKTGFAPHDLSGLERLLFIRRASSARRTSLRCFSTSCTFRCPSSWALCSG